MENILKGISRDFDILPCNDKKTIELSANIRYRVYCQEKSFESLNKTEMEFDEFDEGARHFIVYNKISKSEVATFRIIVSDTLPVDRSLSLYGVEKPIGSFEISRFAILSEYRAQKNKLAIGLFYAGLYSSWVLGGKNLVGEIEKRMAFSIKKSGIFCKKITPFFEHNGQRAVYFTDIESVLFKEDLKVSIDVIKSLVNFYD
jgi:N-acyl-L-homoserine lactone synthetase